ncbi:MAG: hypothetical protein HC915_06565 [Anaerolineae bacterium]|nr:hypothetical protein [Anaerolineae bacterium]
MGDGFGWGSAEVFSGVVGEEFGFITYTTAQEQAQYIVRAFQVGRDLSYVGPMFLDNLNFCESYPRSELACFLSLLDAEGEPRPAFEALQVATP